MLNQSLNITTSPKAIESIKLQRNHHIKQRDLILHHYKRIEKQKQENAQLNERVINSNKIQLDLFENIDSTDTLLEDLKKILPDSQSTAVELQQMNSQLNVLLFQLITHLDETIQENDLLKDKIKALETESKSRSSEKQEARIALRAPEATEVDIEFAPLDLPVFDLDSLGSSKN